MSDARTSSHQMPHGLHHMPPSGVAHVMWPDRFSLPALVGEDAQRARELLRDGQLSADARARVEARARRQRYCALRRLVRGDGACVIGACRDRSVREVVARARGARRRACAAMPRASTRRRPTVSTSCRADLADPARSTRAFAGAHARVPRVSRRRAIRCGSRPTRSRRPSAAGVEHIVKISNIPIAGLDTGLHGNHRAIEAAAGRVAGRVDGAAAVVLHVGAGPPARPDRAGPLRDADRRRPHRVDRPARTSPTVAAAVLDARRRRRRCASPVPRRSTATRSRRRLGVRVGSTRRSTAWRDAAVAERAGPVARGLDGRISTQRSRGTRSPRSPRRRTRARARAAPADRTGSRLVVPATARTADARRRRCPNSRPNTCVGGYGGQPGSPSRANAAHASRTRAPTRRRRRRRRRTRPSRRRSCRT